ncbi:unnamed protein product [Leuciscus chuanchicus]
MNPSQTKEPMTDAKRLLFLRSKVNKSLKDLMKYRQQLETLLPVEGSSELRSLFLMSPADLPTELKRHENLSAKVASCARRADTNKGHFQVTLEDLCVDVAGSSTPKECHNLDHMVEHEIYQCGEQQQQYKSVFTFTSLDIHTDDKQMI